MAYFRYVKLILGLFFILVNISCSNGSYKTVTAVSQSNKYDSEFPYRDGSSQLEEIRIQFIALIALLFTMFIFLQMTATLN